MGRKGKSISKSRDTICVPKFPIDSRRMKWGEDVVETRRGRNPEGPGRTRPKVKIKSHLKSGGDRRTRCIWMRGPPGLARVASSSTRAPQRPSVPPSHWMPRCGMRSCTWFRMRVNSSIEPSTGYRTPRPRCALAAACPLALRVSCSDGSDGSRRLTRKDGVAVDSQRSHECPGAAGRPPQRLRVARPRRPDRHAPHLDSAYHVPAPMRAHGVGQVRPPSSALGGRRRRKRGDARLPARQRALKFCAWQVL